MLSKIYKILTPIFIAVIRDRRNKKLGLAGKTGNDVSFGKDRDVHRVDDDVDDVVVDFTTLPPFEKHF